MKPFAYVTHSAPGRYRLRIPQKRHDTEFFQTLEPDLAALEGVERIVANPVSASVLLLYSDPTLAGEVKGQLTDCPHFELATEREKIEPLWRTASRLLDKLDDELTKTTSGYVDGRSLLFIMLVLLAVRQMQQGALFAPAATFIWSAGRLLTKK